MQKKCNYLRRDSRLEFALSFAKRVPLELWCQPKGDLAVQYQKPPMQLQRAMYMYIYIYRLCNSCIPRWYLYINIYMKYQLTQWISMFRDVVGQRTLPFMHWDHLSKNNRATKSKQPRIELRINKPKTVHPPRTLIFHIWSKEEK